MSQAVQRPGVMGFRAALRAPHRPGRFRHIHAFPGPEKESLLLPERQAADGLLQFMPLFPPKHAIERGGGFRIGRLLDRVLVLVPPLRGAEPAQKAFSESRPAVPVRDPAVENPVEKSVPLLRGPMGITADEMQHGFLDEVQRFFRISRSKPRHAEGLPLHSGQVLVQCVLRIQKKLRCSVETNRTPCL